MIQDGPLDILAAQLVIPSKTGVYITKSEMIVLANLIGGSLRVNERRRMLADVLKSPETLPRLSELIDRIIDLCNAHLKRYADLTTAYPCMEKHLVSWGKNARHTIEELEIVQEELVEADLMET